jgi:hypothetical protein
VFISTDFELFFFILDIACDMPAGEYRFGTAVCARSCLARSTDSGVRQAEAGAPDGETGARPQQVCQRRLARQLRKQPVQAIDDDLD